MEYTQEQLNLMLRYEIQVVLWKGKYIGTIANNLNHYNSPVCEGNVWNSLVDWCDEEEGRHDNIRFHTIAEAITKIQLKKFSDVKTYKEIRETIWDMERKIYWERFVENIQNEKKELAKKKEIEEEEEIEGEIILLGKKEELPEPPIREDWFRTNVECVCDKTPDNDYPCLCDEAYPMGV